MSRTMLRLQSGTLNKILYFQRINHLEKELETKKAKALFYLERNGELEMISKKCKELKVKKYESKPTNY